MVEKFFINPWRKVKAWRSGAGVVSCTRSRIRPWHLLAQNSKPQEPPQPIQELLSRGSSPSHQFGSPKPDTDKMQTNLEKAMWSAKNCSNLPSEVHSLYPMSGGTLSSETRARAGPSSPQGPCDTWHGHTDLGTLDPTEHSSRSFECTSESTPFVNALPRALCPSTAVWRGRGWAGWTSRRRAAEQRALYSGTKCSSMAGTTPTPAPKYGYNGPQPAPAGPIRSGKAGNLPKSQHKTTREASPWHFQSHFSGTSSSWAVLPAMCSMVPKEILHFY